MTPFAEGVWVDVGPVRILGMRLTTTMTVLRLRDGSLLLHSPLPLTAERRAAVEARGPVVTFMRRVGIMTFELPSGPRPSLRRGCTRR